jgi:hypothetical protein
MNMKLQTTKKQIKQGFSIVLSIPYCGAQSLLNCKTPFAYSAGIYGWACDYYQIGGVCISTGYSPIGNPVDYKLLSELEAKAKKLSSDWSIEYSDLCKQLDKLIKELIDSCVKD